MDHGLSGLCRFFAAARERAEPLVLATILVTEGSTYRKAGARILIGADGSSSGLLSGGCLEADLRERAARVLAENRSARIRFDNRETDDPVWGLGMGCEGAMEVWLQPTRPEDQYPVMTYLHRCLETETSGAVATLVGGEATPSELGTHGYLGHAQNDELSALLARHAVAGPEKLCDARFRGRRLQIFVAPVGLPPRILLCGAGPDAIPVQRFASALGWQVTVYDHRPAYAMSALFPDAARVICARPEALAEHLDTGRFAAAIVMSHHLASDAAYLSALSANPPPYIGALGPAARRQRIYSQAGESLRRLAARIHGPIGLDIGADTPETIALAIIAQIQAVLSGRAGGPFIA